MVGKILTREEFNGIEKITKGSGMDNWCQIIQIDMLDGPVDLVQDLENDNIMNLEDALKDFPEEVFNKEWMINYGLTELEQESVLELVNKFGIAAEFKKRKEEKT